MPLRFEVFNLFNSFALLWSPDLHVEELFADSCLLAGKNSTFKSSGGIWSQIQGGRS